MECLDNKLGYITLPVDYKLVHSSSGIDFVLDETKCLFTTSCGYFSWSDKNQFFFKTINELKLIFLVSEVDNYNMIFGHKETSIGGIETYDDLDIKQRNLNNSRDILVEYLNECGYDGWFSSIEGCVHNIEICLFPNSYNKIENFPEKDNIVNNNIPNIFPGTLTKQDILEFRVKNDEESIMDNIIKTIRYIPV